MHINVTLGRDREAAIAEEMTGVCDLKSNTLCIVGKSLIIVLG